MSKKQGWGGARANSGRKPKQRPPAADAAPGEAFSTEHIPDLSVTDIRRILGAILANPKMPASARVSAGRALLGRDDAAGGEASAAADLNRRTLEILNRGAH